MQAAEFDRFADEYLALHARNIRVSGEAPDYFARYKVDEVRRRWNGWRRPPPGAVLDFGCGIGATVPHLAAAFPDADLSALDVSERSLAICGERFPGLARLVRYDGEGALPLSDASQDLVFTSCVFHHIPGVEHVRLLGELRRVLRPGGVLIVFEHNPLNPVTAHIVATCPFDENAVLLPANVLRARLRKAGFARTDIRFTGFFPRALSALRPLEPWLGRLPIGAQYYATAHA